MAVFVQSNTTHGPLSEQMAAEQGPGKAASSNINKEYACPSPSPPSRHVATMTTLGHSVWATFGNWATLGHLDHSVPFRSLWAICATLHYSGSFGSLLVFLGHWGHIGTLGQLWAISSLAALHFHHVEKPCRESVITGETGESGKSGESRKSGYSGESGESGEQVNGMNEVNQTWLRKELLTEL